ncbi:MAG: hypothetical protein AB2A00_22965 [Myxococcota bacterium]
MIAQARGLTPEHDPEMVARTSVDVTREVDVNDLKVFDPAS